MATTRVSEPTREILRTLSETSGESIQAILDKAVELYRRQHFLEEANRAYETLRRNPKLWKAEQIERSAWNSTLADGLEE
jgi:hypothetical protein